MKGSRRFTEQTAQEIRRLLAEVRRSERSLQKRVRQQIRDLGFYISDFAGGSVGFTPQDFDDLIARREIEII